MKSKMGIIILTIILVFFSQNGVSYADIEEMTYLDINLTAPLISRQAISLESNVGFSLYEKDDKLNPIFEIEDEYIKVTLSEDGDIHLMDLNDEMLFTIQEDDSYIMSGNDMEENVIKVERDKYRGYLQFINLGDSIRLINHIDIEEYLYGLVPREMPSSFPPEALKAQAVAARTYAIHNIDKHIKDGYSLCDTTHCQVYKGYDGEKPSTSEAVDETKGMLALYNGDTIDAQYHSSSSGYTNDSLDVWGGDHPYLKSVKDEYSLDAPYSKWDVSIDMVDLNSKLISNGIDVGHIKSVEVFESAENGNVKSLMIRGSSGSKEIKGSTFRSIIGSMDLKSTNFSIKTTEIADNILKSKHVYVMDGDKNKVNIDIKTATIMDKYGVKKISNSTNRAMTMDKVESLNIEEDTSNYSSSRIVIEGKGFGHGVGMSQFGAKKMAELGYDFEEILKFYYTDIDIL